MNKRKMLIVVLLLTLALSALSMGAAFAQDEGEDETLPLSWQTIAADVIGIEEEALMEALADGQSIAEVAETNDVDPQDVIDALVAAQTEARTEALIEAATDFVEQPMRPGRVITMQYFGIMGERGLRRMEVMPFMFGSGRGWSRIEPFGEKLEWGEDWSHMMPFGMFGEGFEFEWFEWDEDWPLTMGRLGFAAGDACLEAVTEAIGIEEEALMEALADGQTIAEVAEANDVEVETVVAALETAAGQSIDAAVEAGRLDEEDAEDMRESLAEAISQYVTKGFPMPHLNIQVAPMWGWDRHNRHH